MNPVFKHSAAVKAGLEDFLAQEKAAADPAVPWQADCLERLLPFSTAGKLLRGSLVCFSYEVFGGKPPGKDVLRAAMALELAHSGLLIHDDIMDNDALRRGKPSMHEQYRLLGGRGKLAEAERFGSGMATSAGDMALFLAFKLLAGCPSKAMELFGSQLAATCAGQMQDLYLEARPGTASKEEIYTLMETKTAAYTIALPLALGAVLAGQPDKTAARVQAAGVTIGTIFQIRDDELGVMGDSRTTGKPVGSDIIEGKKTLLYYYLAERCEGKELQRVRGIYGNAGATGADIAFIRQLVEERGVASLLNDEIGRLEQRAAAQIAGLSLSADNQKAFMELVRFCSRRQF